MSLELKVNGKGFHRTEIISLKTETKCKLKLVQEFPSSTFVDTNEIADLKISRKLDLETFESNETGFHVTFESDFDKTFEKKIPFHIRYANPENGHHTFVLKSPIVYLNCENSESILKNESDFLLSIPTGNSKEYFIVSTLTLISSFMGFLVILLFILRK